MNARRKGLRWVALFLLGIVAGCVQEPPKVSRWGVPVEQAAPATPAGKPASSPKPVPVQPSVTDASAARLWDIEGALLLYYSLNNHLPRQLGDLQSLPGLDVHLELTSPLSGQPYVYVPDGLRAANKSERIIVYDPTPSSDGGRSCILIPELTPSKALSADVLHVPANIFNTYKPATPPTR
jgi:hypothetical protein